MKQENTKKQLFLILFLLAISVLFSGCLQSNATENPPQGSGNTALEQQGGQGNTNNSGGIIVSDEIKKIEVIHFHGTNQCYSCITVGDYAEETINTYFAEELKSGKISFAHINGELAENQEAVQKYEATGSSLWIGTYTSDGKFSKEQNINVWYKIGNKQEYMNYLKGVIEQKLKGE